MTYIIDILTVLGSLGIFIYGMKLMSEGIQKVAGKTLRKILSGMTSNRITGIFTGITTTVLVQSSTATTVMVVSFVNAGLLTLAQSLGVIMGANIGTTVTAWMVSLLGFGKIDIMSFAIGLIGVTFPFLFAKSNKLKNTAEFVVGFGILFIGLEFLKASVPDIRQNPEILEFLNMFTGYGFGTTLIFVLIGTLLTVIVQSSSASTTITLVMLAQGWIDFPVAAAMILGENIGTTITANIASLVGNVHAKRAARFHSIFNLIGIAWMLALFPWFLQFIDFLSDELLGHELSVFTPFIDLPDDDPAKLARQQVATEGLALFHTTFNILNVVLLFGFAKILESVVIRMIPSRSKDEEEFKLQYISAGFMRTPEISLEEASKEMQIFGKLVEKMCANVMILLFKEPRNLQKLLKKIKKREEITDNLQMEISTYLSKLGQSELSEESSIKARNLMRMSNDLERIGDIFYMISLNRNRMFENKIKFPEYVKQELEDYFDLIYSALKSMNQNLIFERVNLEDVYRMENEINNVRDLLKKKHFDRLEKNYYSVEDGILFLDFVNSAEKLGDHIVNVNQAIYNKGTKKSKPIS